MSYDLHDTICAIATAPGGAARGVVRISGSEAVAKLSHCFRPDDAAAELTEFNLPRRVSGSIHVDGGGDQAKLEVRGDLLVWPSNRSYTREPAAEFHTIGSPPLLAAVVEQLGCEGIRPAGPGEFTLRAFLAGRIDLTQAEAVLGVIDARDRSDLDAALDQLAGGLSRPLHRLREQLLGVLAELEAGLDFVEEDIKFISRDTLGARLMDAQAVVAATIEQLSTRDAGYDLPSVVIMGPPNAGKSSLFNALVRRWGDGRAAGSIVSPQPGATRDYVTARLNLDGVACELVDTAGLSDDWQDDIHSAAQRTAAAQRRRADIHLSCIDAATAKSGQLCAMARDSAAAEVCVVTKVDLADARNFDGEQTGGAGVLTCSSLTGAGLDTLAERLRHELHDASLSGVVAPSTSARCGGSLRDAQRALAAALELTECGGEELIAAEIRGALDALGEVVGAISTDDVLDRVFSQFCIGK